MGKFYLGRRFDLAKMQSLPEKIEYDSADLTTHAVVTGMTGSGKTGLCVGLMEEAALQGIPSIILDVKGDLTNLLLHFPDLAPQDFQPWMDAASVRRQGKTPEQAAQETAEMWKNGLAEWDLGPEQIRALKDAVDFAIYTPGSDAGLRVSVLTSLQAPDLSWDSHSEILREKIGSTVTALLGLVGMSDVDPVRSRDHILLSNIFEDSWRKGQSLDLTELIMQTQKPSFEKLGAFPVDSFFPEKDRTSLAMMLNNILAAPGFASWREGQPLDMPGFLYTPEGKPRHSVFYLAHLSDTERMFFVTLLLSAFETWMRTQAGSQSLRAILYFDEIFGYLPPTRNPSSKMPLLRMLKQARAFGVGLLLATQNPVDVDYKALSNAGTWFVGKLQTDQDKERLLDGLESAAAGLARAEYGRIISALGKRAFLLHNVHEKKPVLFQTRWVMNYLAGPLTRPQIPALNKLVGAVERASSYEPAPRVSKKSSSREGSKEEGSQTKPLAPSNVREYFLPMRFSLTEAFKEANESMPEDAKMLGVLYRPALLAAASVRFLDRRYGVDADVPRVALVDELDKRGSVRWEKFVLQGLDVGKMDSVSAPQARFTALSSALADPSTYKSLESDFSDWLYRTSTVTAKANEALKVYGGPDVSMAEFKQACAEAARSQRDAEISKEDSKLDKKIATISDRMERETRELKQDESELTQRKWEEGATLFENVAGLLGGKSSSRRLSSSVTKRRLTAKAKADVEESVEAIAKYERQIKELEAERENLTEEISARWADVVSEVSEITVTPKKSDIYIQSFGIAWMPYYAVQSKGETIELPAFGGDA